jgi:glycerophosphoryl diester phosphodiesterase
MRRASILLVVLWLGLTSCGDDAGTGSSEDAPSTDGADSAASTTTTSASTTTTTTQPPPDRPSVTELLASGAPLNIAHAGGDQAAPHSTLFAFSEAVAAGAGVLEMDVLLSGDGVLIVQHDDTVDKTTEETGPVLDRTLAQLQELDNAYWFSPECWPCQDRPVEEYIYRGVRTGQVPPPQGYTPEDFTIATFREVAERFPDLPFDIEIKGEAPHALEVAQVLADELAELDRLDSSVVVSFDDEVITAFRDMAPEVAVSPGLNTMAAWVLGGQPLDPAYRIVQVPPSFEGLSVVTPAFVERARAEGLTVWVWMDDAATQENEAFYRELLDLGVDGIIAGRPAEVTAALG